MLGGACVLAPVAQAAGAETGGAPVVSSQPASDGAPGGESFVAPAGRARLVAGRATAPADAPAPVIAAVAAANRLVGKPYRYGGGHASFSDSGYDCSGAVSYALRGGRLLRSPLDSSAFMRWGARGPGRWITVYTNPGHAYVVIAGLRFDTSLGDRSQARRSQVTGTGPRWGGPRSPQGFVARHPVGL